MPREGRASGSHGVAGSTAFVAMRGSSPRFADAQSAYFASFGSSPVIVCLPLTTSAM